MTNSQSGSPAAAEGTATSARDWSRAAPAFAPAEDGVQPISDAPLWSESFHGSGYDPERRVGFFVHLARAQFDPGLWDETFVAFLPDGRFLACRDFAYGDTPEGPAANLVSYRHGTPYDDWEIHVRGAARLVTAQELETSALTDDEYVGVELSLKLRAIGPAFGIGGIEDAFWAHFHTEQHVELSGELKYEDQLLEIRGTGMRDHSVGPRDVSRLDRHTWCHGEFPSGRLFMAMDVDAGDGTTLQYAVTGDGEQLREARMVRPGGSLLAAPEDEAAPYAVELETSDGPAVIRAEIVQSLPLSLRGTNSWVLGARTDAHHMMYECQTRFEWAGEVGYGLTERSVRI